MYYPSESRSIAREVRTLISSGVRYDVYLDTTQGRIHLKPLSGGNVAINPLMTSGKMKPGSMQSVNGSYMTQHSSEDEISKKIALILDRMRRMNSMLRR